MAIYKIIMEVNLPDDYNESEIDLAIADAIYDNGGDVIDIKEYIKVKDEE